MAISAAPAHLRVPGPAQDDTLGDFWTQTAGDFAARIALRAGGVDYSYENLNLRAQALSSRLRAAGLQAGDVCGVHLGRSAECVIAILAVTLAGGAWLPLDPAYPKARLRAMADEVGIKLLLMGQGDERFALNCRPEVVYVDARGTTVPGSPDAAPTWTAQGDDLAYIIYTSGSTGRPKGIQIHHHALLIYLASMAKVLPAATFEKVVSVSSPSFDISLLDLFLTFGSGGTVVLATPGEARDGRRLKALLAAERPSLLQATPATWRLLLAAGWEGHAGLTLLTGAEAISPRMACDLKARADHLWNLYGPTETTLWATAGEISDEDIAASTIHIGRRLEHFETLILDEARQPATKGETGELWLLGPTLSRGYVGQPALTVERFVGLPQGVAYRTGDRVAQRPDGQLSFHGRIDNQIKINSVRIEPAEVEAVLSRHGAVREVIVAAKALEDGDDALKLVAYVVFAEGGEDEASLVADLQHLAKAHLPVGMCPAHYAVVPDLPLTPSGKIDRNALPVPEAMRPALHGDHVAPRDALELRLAALMSDTLGVRPIGVRDSFFDLGGDSLATVEFLLALEKALDAKVEVSRFLESPTVEALAETINSARAFRPSTALVTLQAEGEGPPLFLIHGAGGLAFTVFELGQAVCGKFPVFAVQDPACDPALEPARTVPEMATALIAQIKTAQAHGPYRLCGHSFGGLLAYEMAVQLERDGEAVGFVGMLDTPTPPLASSAHGPMAALKNAWRELRFFGQILTQAGPMALDGLYVLFGAEARYQSTRAAGEGTGVGAALRATWANALFRSFHGASGLASAVGREPRLLMMRQPGIRRSIQLTGVHDKARRTYRPEPYGGKVTLLRAQQVSAETQGYDEESLGWAALAAEAHVERVPGSHFSMTRGKNLPVLAGLLERALARLT
ncbi:MAG: amino acid adenylation domain-containing protein [Alphaproteobacteria bacterium]|nr:amino acid adenylation domain-containing protein [Alphaproteobacteria bacterium]